VATPAPPGTGSSTSGVDRRRVVAVLAVLAVAALLATAAVGTALVWLGPRPPAASAPSAAPTGGDPAATSPGTGASSDGYAVWARNDDGTPVRWDPCSPIEVVVATDSAPAGAWDDLEEAVGRVEEVTGLTFRLGAITDERPRADRPPYQPARYGHRWAPVLVAWAEPHEGGIRLRSSDRGVAVPIAVGPPGDRTYVTAQLVLNADRTDLASGFEDRAWSWGSTILHELAHVVGLDHVDDPDELLHVHPGAGSVTFGPGDLAGLAAVGAQHGCREVPAPQHVEVADPVG
jgi:hypothetical protein